MSKALALRLAFSNIIMYIYHYIINNVICNISTLYINTTYMLILFSNNIS